MSTRLLEEWVKQYRDDPEYRVYRILDDVTDAICGRMEDEGISRSDLAARLGVSSAYVTKFLNTPRNTTLESIVRFAGAVGLQVEVVLKPAQPPPGHATAETQTRHP